MTEPTPAHPQPTATPTDCPLPSGSRVAILANAQSGSGKTAELAAEALEHLGHASMRCVGPDCHATAFTDQMEQLEGLSLDAIIAIGGDGTVNAAANIARQTDALLIIVPAGTMDLVAADLGLGHDPTAVVRSLDRITVRHIDAGSVEGHLFLHSSLIGVVPAMARARERARGTGLFGHLDAAATWLRYALAFPGHTLRLRSKSRSAALKTKSIAVTVGAIAGQTPLSYRREALDSGRLTVYASRHKGPFAAPRLLFSIAASHFESDPETIHTDVTELTVESAKSRLSITADGEIRTVPTPLRYQLHPGKIRVAIPTDEGTLSG